jgi:hypothetical protein
VSLYLDDPREAVLIKTETKDTVYRQLAHERASRKGNRQYRYLLLGIIILCLIWKQCAPVIKNYIAPPVVVNVEEVAKPAPTAPVAAKPKPKQLTVEQALAQVNDGKLWDLNKDGLINCIDYAIRFKQLYPSAIIVRNYNKKTGMNHLFNYADGKYIEPQRTKNYLMREAWPTDRYDPELNKDETKIWMAEVK